MIKRTTRAMPALAGAAMLLAAVGPSAMAAGGTATGPSSGAAPYLVPVANGVRITSILTVGDTVRGYAMAGIPDGLGAIGEGEEDGFTLFMNHEINNTLGVTRAHGSKGAFVSQWSIDPRTLRVRKGEDLIETVNLWNGTGWTEGTTAFGRFCSADLPEKSAFWDPRSRTGFNGRIFMNGEEIGDEGRAFAHIVTGRDKGTSYELPALGNMSFENSLANPDAGRKTIVALDDDTNPLGQVYIYVGEKQRDGNPVERAGLTGGTLFGIKVGSLAAEDRDTGIGSNSSFTLASLGDVTGRTGAQIQADSVAAGVTSFLRPEDGSWDPRNPRDYYFVTTDRLDTVQAGSGSQVGNSRLWRLRFDDLDDPAAGGTIRMLLDGTGANAPQMMDNITIDRTGHIIIQEDPGNNEYLAKVWSYDIASGDLTLIAQHDPAKFTGTATTTFNHDEESSGVIDASKLLGKGWFLLDVQAHYETTTELVEGGQLLAIFNPDSAGRGSRD